MTRTPVSRVSPKFLQASGEVSARLCQIALLFMLDAHCLQKLGGHPSVDKLLTDGFFFAMLMVLIRCSRISIFLAAALQKKSGRGSVKKSHE